MHRTVRQRKLLQPGCVYPLILTCTLPNWFLSLIRFLFLRWLPDLFIYLSLRSAIRQSALHLLPCLSQWQILLPSRHVCGECTASCTATGELALALQRRTIGVGLCNAPPLCLNSAKWQPCGSPHSTRVITA